MCPKATSKQIGCVHVKPMHSIDVLDIGFPEEQLVQLEWKT